MGRAFTKAIKSAEMQGVLKQIPPDTAQAMGQTNTLLGNIVKASGVATPVVQPVASLQFDNEERAKRVEGSLGRAAFGPERIREILMQLKGLNFLADGGRVGYQAGGPATPEQYLSALQKVGAGSAEQKTRSLGDYVLNYTTQAGQQLFPEGNFQRIRSAAPTQRDYNIQVNADLARNLPGGLAKDIVAPAAAAALSLPYDAIQAYTRMKPESGIKGYFDAFMAEKPFSSLSERFIGASAPLAERFSSTPLGTQETTPTPSSSTNKFMPLNYFIDILQHPNILKELKSGTFKPVGGVDYSQFVRPDESYISRHNLPVEGTTGGSYYDAETLYKEYLKQTPFTNLTATEGSFAKGGSVDDIMGITSLFTRKI
jgi:hypothetical protein